MDYSHHQAINTLLKERVRVLENTVRHLREEEQHLLKLSVPGSLAGQEAYESLNKTRNKLNYSYKKLTKWREVHLAFSQDHKASLEEQNSWARITGGRGLAYLGSLLSGFRGVASSKS